MKGCYLRGNLVPEGVTQEMCLLDEVQPSHPSPWRWLRGLGLWGFGVPFKGIYKGSYRGLGILGFRGLGFRV